MKNEWLEDLKKEFFQLRNDDPDFAKLYDENDFEDWLIDNNLNTEARR